MRIDFFGDFNSWRREARRCLLAGVLPDEVSWGTMLFREDDFALNASDPSGPGKETTFTVPKLFIEQARIVSHHRDPSKWRLLYRILWRLKNENPNLMQILIDDDIHQLFSWAKNITRDAHKTKAFVRFKKITADELQEWYVAWHEPDHLILPLVAPFFHRRFRSMNWLIATPDATCRWDGKDLVFLGGMRKEEIPSEDQVDDLWRDYYKSTFNPARLKVRAMTREMPRRFWKNLPEAELIPDMIAEAETRINLMLDRATPSVAEHLPADATLESLRMAVKGCRGCDLHQYATQAVSGEGPDNASIVMVGEQPGDEEDRQGRVFVGPAGQVLDSALRDTGIERNDIYITNAVKHFKWKPDASGKRRLHERPNTREMRACRPWVLAELRLHKANVVVCLGVTAAESLLDRKIKLQDVRGQFLKTAVSDHTFFTYHPSAILRAATEADQKKMYAQLVEDLHKLLPFLKKNEGFALTEKEV